MRWIYLVAWLACVLYSTIPLFWMMVHPRAEKWRLARESPYRILVPAWVAMWLVVGAATAPWRNLRFYSASWTWGPALLLLGTGLCLYAQSSRGFSLRQLGGVSEVAAGQREQRLVVSGIRTHVRHPIYLAHFCEMLAWSIGTGLIVCYGLTAFALLTGTRMIQMEERELEQRLGEQYRAYRKTVPAFLPRF